MNSTHYIYGSRMDASTARTESRPDAEDAGQVALLQPAIVREVQAPGVYKVATLADDGTDSTEIEGVRTFPAADLSPDTPVWLVRWPGNPMPIILVSGGGGGPCWTNQNVGVYFA